MDFQTLLNQLPHCPGSGGLRITRTPGGFRYIEKGLPEFVGPDVLPSSEIVQPNKPRIIVISAAGAVGKSTLGREIAYRKQAPLLDLAQASAVGEHSMTGQLTSSFGLGQIRVVSSQLAVGELFLIVDALDEARVKANEAGFEAFIQDIAGIAKAASGIAFVLLGRTQTAEWTQMLLEEAGALASSLSIQPFTRRQAERYIEARIENFDKAAAKRIAYHPKPFVAARDLILDHLQRAVGGEGTIKEEVVREFLGYAPVLETVAVLLAQEGNYQEFTESLRELSKEPKRQMDRPLAVLEHVVTRLLEREQKQKLQRNIKPVLEKLAAETGWGDWDRLYSPEEQRTRLLARVLGQTLDACPHMPASVRSRYEEGIRTWLPEHPFLRDGTELANKVFESYLFATAMREYLTPLSRLIEARVAATDYRPSRLLADFYILLGERRGEEVIAERQIGLLYDSLLAGETDSLRVRLSVESGEPDEEGEEEDEGEGEFELVYSSSQTNGTEQIVTRRFKIVAAAGSLSFRRQLKEAAIVTRGAVILGGVVDDFEIGPGVDIRCGKLQIGSSGLVVRGSLAKGPTESDAVVLEAGQCESQVLRKPVVRGSLTLRWPGADAYPWNEFSVPIPDEGGDGGQMHEVYRRFRRIVTCLQSHSRGGLARYRAKVEHRRVLKGGVGRALLDRLVKDGIMKLEREFYHWVPDRADALLRVSWHDLRLWQRSPELNVYLQRFIAENPRLLQEQ